MKKPRYQKPEDSVEWGPIRGARFGATTVWQNTATTAQHRLTMESIAANLPKLQSDLDKLVAEIVSRVHRHDPLELLRMAYGNFVVSLLGTRSESELSFQEGSYGLTLEYLQSVIAGTSDQGSERSPLTDEVFQELHARVKELYSTCGLQFLIARSAARQIAQSPGEDPHEDLRTECEMWWSAVRKTRYQAHDIPYLERFLSPHSQVFEELFGISAKHFVENVEQLQRSLSHGIGEALETLERSRLRAVAQLEAARESNEQELERIRDQLRGDPDVIEAGERFLGDANYDVLRNTSLPTVLLDALSWAPGEETESFHTGVMRGWPLRVLPWRKRPFLKLGGRYYCHNPSALMDNLYRIVEKLVCRLRTEYRAEWTKRQARALEEFSLELFARLLPGAIIIPSVRYQWPPTRANDKNWTECDGLVIFDDHLIVVEARSGSFTHTAPTDDFDAHIASTMALIQKPLTQVRRFLEYLESRESVPLYREVSPSKYDEVVTLRRADFRVVTACGVTLDNFGHLAARAGKLDALGVGGAGQSLWSIAIDDLMVCADIFESPVTFCHFLEQRQAASRSVRFELRDEVDHLGMYFSRNQYSRLAEEFAEGIQVTWAGFGAIIDEYFSDRLRDPDTVKRPTQGLQGSLKELIAALDRSREQGRCFASSLILNLGDEGRGKFEAALARFIQRSVFGEPGRLLSMPGDAPLTIIVSSELAEWKQADGSRAVARAMLAVGQKERIGLELTVDAECHILASRPFVVRIQDFGVTELGVLENEAKELAERRIAKELDNRERKKIGRNEKCPCGSGKKYKKCHGA